jgi:hypothetical protein
MPAELEGDSFFLEVPREDGSTRVSQLMFKAKPQDLVSGVAGGRVLSGWFDSF